jgi:hypothetical protein
VPAGLADRAREHRAGGRLISAGPAAAGGLELPICLSEPDGGAPFGLSIVAPVVAGPLDLGRIVTQAEVEVDPRTAQLTITTDPLPQNLDGIPGPSQIGSATMRTPVLGHPLKGRVYFDSYGTRKFPDIVLVLEGDGVRISLRGETSIGAGKTTVTFGDTPDIRLESIEVRLPRGPYSELAARLPAKARGSLCGQRLVMPTRVKAQNGLVIERRTRIGVVGCSKRARQRQAETRVASRAWRERPTDRARLHAVRAFVAVCSLRPRANGEGPGECRALFRRVCLLALSQRQVPEVGGLQHRHIDVEADFQSGREAIDNESRIFVDEFQFMALQVFFDVCGP